MRPMNIRSTKRFDKAPRPSKTEAPAKPSEAKAPPPWRRITLNEAAVEIPQSLLELSGLDQNSPLTAKALQGGVAGLATLRSIQCFHDAESVEEILEGVSSGALAVAGAATLFPGAHAGLAHRGFLVGHGAAELALGIREIHEELKKDSPAKLELAAGVLDSIKGASTFIPILYPEASDFVNLFQIGAITTKTIMEPMMERSRQA